MVTLGKTGQKVPALGMGTSWVVAAELRAGGARRRRPLHRHLGELRGRQLREGRSARSSSGPRCGRTSTSSPRTAGRKIGGPGRSQLIEQRLNASLERLRTDYVDCYYLHGVDGREIPLFSDPDVKAAFEKLKKSGKIRFCGLSCHDRRLPEIVTAAAEVRLDRPDHDPVQLPDHERRRRSAAPSTRPRRPTSASSR